MWKPKRFYFITDDKLHLKFRHKHGGPGGTLPENPGGMHVFGVLLETLTAISDQIM